MTSQLQLDTLKPIDGVLDATAGLLGMQYRTRILASVNVDASPYRMKKRQGFVRADFTKLPFKDESFHLVHFDPPHTIDTRNTLFGTLEEMSGLGPHLGAFKYGCYRTIKQLRESVAAGAAECARVLTPNGTLIFKWSNSEKPYSWATDTVEKVAPTLDKFRLQIERSGARTSNHTFYVWYHKLSSKVERGPG